MSSEQQIFNFATIGEVFEDGVSLIFDGQEAATEKHYRVNTSIVFKAGDRVKILADSGTYVVEYVVGRPKKTDDTEADEIHGIPSGGATGQSLIKSSNNDYAVSWGFPVMANAVVNQRQPTMDSFQIQFYTDLDHNFYIRVGTSSQWKKITVT